MKNICSEPVKVRPWSVGREFIEQCVAYLGDECIEFKFTNKITNGGYPYVQIDGRRRPVTHWILERLGVSQTQIGHVTRGEAWIHVG